MKTLLCVLFLLFVSQFVAAQKIDISGFGSLNIPTKKEMKYELRWARVDVNVVDDWYQAEVEYDVSQPSLKKSYGRLFTNASSGEASLVFGRFLNTVSYLHHGPKTLPVTRWPEALNDMDIYVTGLGVWYKDGDFTFRVAHFAKNGVTATVSYKGLSTFYYKGVGYGLIIDKEINDFLNPHAGVTMYDDEHTAAFVQNHIKLPFNFRLYGQIDFGDFKPLWLIGVNYEIKENTFAKVFYDTKDYGWKAELTFAF